jgi:hypothetical protein
MARRPKKVKRWSVGIYAVMVTAMVGALLYAISEWRGHPETAANTVSGPSRGAGTP